MNKNTRIFMLNGTMTAETNLAISYMKDQIDKEKRAMLPIGADGQPFYPASGILGAWRRSAMSAIAEARQSQGIQHPIGLAGYITQVLGGLSFDSKNDAENRPLAIQAMRNDRPMESLFGSARMSAKLGVSHATLKIPLKDKAANKYGRVEKDILEFHGVRTGRDFQQDANKLDFFSPDEVEKMVEFMDNQTAAIDEIRPLELQITSLKKESRAMRAIQSMNPEEQERLAFVLEGISEIEQQIDDIKGVAGNQLQMPYAGYQYFAKGTVFEHRIKIINPSEKELNILIAALKYFSIEPRLGGHANHECGWVKFHWHVSVREGLTAAGSWGNIDLDLEKGLVIDDNGSGHLKQIEANAERAMEAGFLPESDYVLDGLTLSKEQAQEEKSAAKAEKALARAKVKAEKDAIKAERTKAREQAQEEKDAAKAARTSVGQ
jgi:hypothetical protein